MAAMLLILVMLAVLGAFFVFVLARVGDAWFEHRFKLTLLERLMQRPGLARSFPELEALLREDARKQGGQRLNFAVMGSMLAVLGVLAVLAGQWLGTGRLAAGLYFGGAACVPMGFTLALTGWFVRMLSRHVDED